MRRGPFARERQRLEARWQHGPEHLFARLTRDANPDLGRQHRRNAVGELAIDMHFEIVGFGRRARAATERHFVAAPLHRHDGLAVDFERDDADSRGHMQRLGPRVPLEASAHIVRAGREPERRAFAKNDRRRLAVDGDLLRPLVVAAGQRHPRFGLDAPVLRDCGAVRVGADVEHAGPGAEIFVGGLALLADEQRARAELLAVHDPGPPRLERRRHLRLGVCEDGRQDCGQPDDANQQCAHGHSS